MPASLAWWFAIPPQKKHPSILMPEEFSFSKLVEFFRRLTFRRSFPTQMASVYHHLRSRHQPVFGAKNGGFSGGDSEYRFKRTRGGSDGAPRLHSGHHLFSSRYSTVQDLFGAASHGSQVRPILRRDYYRHCVDSLDFLVLNASIASL